MSDAVQARFRSDLAAARSASRSGEPGLAWAKLEEAHVLSQPWPWPHIRTHVEMLKLAVRARDAREALGQVARLVLAGPGSAAGRYPVGNTGRARVSVFVPMPMPADVSRLLEDTDG